MVNNPLESLRSGEFDARMHWASTPEALFALLSKSEEVRALRDGLRQGTLHEQDAGEFASQLMRAFQRGVLFPHDLALCGLAVALSQWHTEFAREFLRSVAGLRLAEMRMSWRVAKIALEKRESGSQSEYRSFRSDSISAPRAAFVVFHLVGDAPDKHRCHVLPDSYDATELEPCRV